MLAAVLAVLVLDATAAAAGDPPPSAEVRDWLAKRVCVDAADRPLPVDPFPACPAGTGMRKVRFGEAIPYHNVNQPGFQQSDALPGRDREGREIFFHTFDYAPFNRFNLFDGSDGFDSYVIRDGWVSSPDTRDGGGFGTAFFGEGCRSWGGWVYFPETGFLGGGEIRMPIAVQYWEQSAQDFPGGCPAGYSAGTWTDWRFEPSVAFGGVNGQPVKSMPALVSRHGFRDDPGFRQQGHLEIFYFTEFYGLTRWEVWSPVEQGGRASAECAGTQPRRWRGVAFVITDCHDWSRIVPAEPPTRLAWPLPVANLLRHFHFGPGFERVWRTRDGAPVDERSIRLSSLPADTLRGRPGVRTLALGAPIHQDVPVEALRDGATYAFGASGHAATPAGARLRLSLSQRGAEGQELRRHESRVFDLPQRAGRYAHPRRSVVLASETVLASERLALDPRTVLLRFEVAPLGPEGAELLDTWLFRLDEPAVP